MNLGLLTAAFPDLTLEQVVESVWVTPRAVYDYGDRIFHAHAKDPQVRRDGLYRHGSFSGGMGWRVPRLPGLGEVERGFLLARDVLRPRVV